MNEKLPSSYQRVEDVLRLVGQLHKSMENLCHSARARSDSTQHRLLFDTLAGRQQEMTRLWEGAFREIDAELTREWLQYFPGDQLEKHLDNMGQESRRNGETRTDIAAAQRDLADMVRKVAEQSGSPRTRELLTMLAERESSEARYTSEAITELNDL